MTDSSVSLSDKTPLYATVLGEYLATEKTEDI
jgi:hypothetical protein